MTGRDPREASPKTVACVRAVGAGNGHGITRTSGQVDIYTAGSDGTRLGRVTHTREFEDLADWGLASLAAQLRLA